MAKIPVIKMEKIAKNNFYVIIKAKRFSKRFNFRIWLSCLIMKLYARISPIKTTIEFKWSKA
jgi:hypothetical protein